MIQSVLGRFANPPKPYLADIYAEKHKRQGPVQMFFCPVAPQWCDADCDHCLEFVTTCDRCHCAGHCESSGWTAVNQADGQPRVLCLDCLDEEMGELKNV
jgi:hypothetical protein